MQAKNLTQNLHNIFYPKSVAVLGTNSVPGTVPNDLLINILKSDFQGTLYPVSQRDKFISCIKTFKYIIDIDDPIDLAVIVFQSSVCHLAMEQCGQKGVKAAIVISAGFKENGEAGAKREAQLKKIADKYGISFIGPNCLGVINTDPEAKLNASFARKMPDEGSIAFLSQSGALCTAVLDYAQAKNIGFSKFVSFGNKTDISEIDLLLYLKDDPKTKVILLYLEEIIDGSGLMNAAKEVIKQTGKPILAIKAGRTDEGAAAAALHTGSLTGSDQICEAAFKQSGIIRCNNIEDMFNKAIALNYQPLPKSNRIAIVTNAGGPGVLTTDAAIQEGLKLATFSNKTTERFKKFLPKTANITNPVDVIGDAHADRYNIAISNSLSDDNVDGVFIILTPQSMTDIENIAKEITTFSIDNKKPIYTSFMGEADVAKGINILQKNNIPNYLLPESMSKAFATAYNFKNNLNSFKDEGCEILNNVDKHRVALLLREAQNNKKKYLLTNEAEELLKAYNLPVLPSAVVKSENDAVVFAHKIGFPVVMKIVSDDIVHKSDVGGIVLNISTENEVKEAFQQIKNVAFSKNLETNIRGIQVTKMITSGNEVLVGIKRDPAFGPIIVFGLGGIYVEIFKDVSFRIAPVSKKESLSMIMETKSSTILAGARGKNINDIESIQTCIQRVSQLALDFPQIVALDINPLIVLQVGMGAYVADAKIMIK